MRKEQNRSIFSICEARRAGGLSHYWKYSNWTIFLPPFLCHAAQVGKKRAFLSRQRADYFFLPASSSVKFFLMKKLLSWNTRNFNVSCFFFICAFHTKSWRNTQNCKVSFHLNSKEVSPFTVRARVRFICNSAPTVQPTRKFWLRLERGSLSNLSFGLRRKSIGSGKNSLQRHF